MREPCTSSLRGELLCGAGPPGSNSNEALGGKAEHTDKGQRVLMGRSCCERCQDPIKGGYKLLWDDKRVCESCQRQKRRGESWERPAQDGQRQDPRGTRKRRASSDAGGQNSSPQTPGYAQVLADPAALGLQENNRLDAAQDVHSPSSPNQV